MSVTDRDHLIALASFSKLREADGGPYAIIDCICGVTVDGSAVSIHEAYQLHRREAGLERTTIAGTIGARRNPGPRAQPNPWRTNRRRGGQP